MLNKPVMVGIGDFLVIIDCSQHFHSHKASKFSFKMKFHALYLTRQTPQHIVKNVLISNASVKMHVLTGTFKTMRRTIVHSHRLISLADMVNCDVL